MEHTVENKFKVTVVISQQTPILNNLYLITKNPQPGGGEDEGSEFKLYEGKATSTELQGVEEII